MFYSNTILEDINSSSSGGLDPTTGTVLIGVVNFIGAMFATLPLKYFGRKTILIAGHISMVVSLVIVGILSLMNQNTLVLVFIFVFLVSY